MIRSVLSTLAVVAGTILLVDYALAIPTVYTSYSTRECVSVEAYPGFVFDNTGYTCSNKPPKYDHQWVQ